MPEGSGRFCSREAKRQNNSTDEKANDTGSEKPAERTDKDYDLFAALLGPARWWRCRRAASARRHRSRLSSSLLLLSDDLVLDALIDI